MDRIRSISNEFMDSSELSLLDKSLPNGLSNTFNPPIPGRIKTPLPAIPSHQNTFINGSMTRKASIMSTDMTRKASIISADFTRKASIISGDMTLIFSSRARTNDLVLPMKVFKAPKKSINDLSQAACSHLWFRRIKEIFLVMGKQNDPFTRFDMDLARTDMIQTCEQYLESERPNENNNKQLTPLELEKLNRWKTKRLYAETFRMSYFRKEADSDDKTNKKSSPKNLSSKGGILNFDNAIWWYSFNEAPIFDQMNNILRLENFELLMCHRYYISDLCQMIEQSYIQNKPSSKIIVYRADKLSRSDFETLLDSKNQKDAIISINGFISTSRNRDISLQYATRKLGKQGNDVVIMYEITIDPAIPCSAFADIQTISFHPEEEEILFNMGATFQINDIDDEPTNPNIKQIKLTARDFNRELLDSMKAKVKYASQATLSILLTRYLIELGEDRVSKRYLNQLIDSKQLENDTNLVAAYNALGTIYYRQALYGEALDCFQKALDTQARLQFSNNNAFAEIFNFISQAHLGLGQLDEAEQNLEEGIRIQKREPKYAQQHLAALYCTMGQVTYARKDYDEAETNFQNSYDLYKRNTKISPDALERRLLTADLCVAYGHLLSVKDSKHALVANEKFDEALNIYESTLPSSHPKVTEVRIEILCEYARNKYFDPIISSYNDGFILLLKNYEMKQTTSQQDLAKLYAIIGACHAYRKEFDKAMEIWKKSIEHELKSFLDELLSSTRISRIVLPKQLIERAYRDAFEYYSNQDKTKSEYLGILYAKRCIYDKAIECLRGMSSYLLVSICIMQRNSKGTLAVYKRILDTQDYDLSCVVGLLLQMLTMRKSPSYEESLKELVGIDKLLAKTSNENEAIRLRMVINDYLAEAHLLAKRYDRAQQRSRLSFDLKQRHFSTNHPSLVRNYQLYALCSIQQNDRKTAVAYYNRAVEIQLDNMPSDHREIRLNYFLIGDCYCQMEKLDMAKEFYEQARTTDDVDTEKNSETKEDIEALKRMNLNLANLYAKSENFNSARSYQNDRVIVMKKNIPEYIVQVIENDDASIVPYDRLQASLVARLCLQNGETFGQVLHDLVYIYLSLARALIPDSQNTYDDKDATDIFEQAIQLDFKLTMFKTNEEDRSVLLYEEISDAYERLYFGMNAEIKENLMKALNEATDTKHQLALEYRLGQRCFIDEDYSGADRYWRQALDKTEESQTTIKTILEKLIEKSQDQLAKSDEDEDEQEKNSSDENENDETKEDSSEDDDHDERKTTTTTETTEDHSSKSQNPQSTKTTNDKTQPEDLAQAYLDLHDKEMAVKYFKKHAIKLASTVKYSRPNTEIEEKPLSIIQFFQTLLLQTVNSDMSSLSKSEENSDKQTWENLLEVYKKIYEISLQLETSNEELTKTNSIIFQLYQKSYDIPEEITTVYQLLFENNLDNLQWNQFIDLLDLKQYVNILMRIAAYYTSNEDYTKALEMYCTLQNTIKEEGTMKSAVNYGILKLFSLYLQSTEEQSSNIRAIELHSTDIPIFDRILLCRLAISFCEELEDQKAITEFKFELFNLQNEVWTVQSLETTDCMGDFLTEVQDYSLARLYWNDVELIYHEMFNKPFLTLLHSDDSTFEQLFRAAKQMIYELPKNIVSLAESYELLSTYEEKDEWKDNARDSLKKAIMTYDKIPAYKEKLTTLKERLDAMISK